MAEAVGGSGSRPSRTRSGNEMFQIVDMQGDNILRRKGNHMSSDTYFIDDAIGAIGGFTLVPTPDEAHLLGFALFPKFVFELFTGQYGY